ncbi:MAG: hypothetical protein H6558_06910 [Lewinellaceae bacterium]|nr:hypothetical protein [Lewinellaceae bacterium]
MSTFSTFSYPVFRKGQVLKNSDLNGIIRYLEEQGRQTRRLLAGTGIFNGLRIQVQGFDGEGGTPLITVNAGAAISSDGHLILLEEDCVFGRFKETSLSRALFECEPQNGNANGGPAGFYEVLELIPRRETDAPDLTNVLEEEVGQPLEELITRPGEYSLVLLSYHEEKGRPFCIDACDELGSDATVRVMALLMKKEEICHQVNTANTELCQSPRAAVYRLKLSRPARPDKSDPVRHPSDKIITAIREFNDNYKDACKYTAASVAEVYSRAFTDYREILMLGEDNPFAGLKARLEKRIDDFPQLANLSPNAPDGYLGVQYLYGYLRDMALAYEEFADTACLLKEESMSNRCAYPTYVISGGVVVNGGVNSNEDCRTSFVPASSFESNYNRIEQAKFWFRRMETLAAPGNLLELPLPANAFSDIRITPGMDNEATLSERPLPYYYRESLLTQWVYRGAEGKRTRIFRGYRFRNGTPPDDNPLLYSLDSYPFFRIEGHIGKKAVMAKQVLEALTEQNNLPFDVVFVKLGQPVPRQQMLRDFDYGDLNRIFTKAKEILWEHVSGRAQNVNFFLSIFQSFLFRIDVTNYECSRMELLLRRLGVNLEECLVEGCLNTFQMLRNIYEAEKDAQAEEHLFPDFVREHPGLEHRAGAPRGGTFVVLYASVASEPDMRVVGDFCLPYRCCDEGRFVPDPFLVLATTAFCSDDQRQYEIWRYPLGGEVKGIIPGLGAEGTPQDFLVEDEASGKLLFQPSAVPLQEGAEQMELWLQYLYRGKEAVARLSVYRMPVVSLTAAEPQPVYDVAGKYLTGFRLRITPSVSGEFATQWRVDGVTPAAGSIGDDGALSHAFLFSDKLSYQVEFRATNGPCVAEASLSVDLCKHLRDMVRNNTEGTTPIVTPAQPLAFEEETGFETALAVFPPGGQFRMYGPGGARFRAPVAIQSAVGQDGIRQFVYTFSNNPANGLMRGVYHLEYFFPYCDIPVVALPVSVTTEPAIVIEKDKFCTADKGRYLVTLFPRGGDFSVNGVGEEQIVELEKLGMVREANDIYVFVPGNVQMPDGQHQLALTLKYDHPDDGSATFALEETISIYRLPEVICEKDPARVSVYDDANLCALLGYEIGFTSSEGVESRYEWRVNDHMIDIGAGLSTFRHRFLYQEDDQFVVTLIAFHEESGCRVESSCTVNLECFEGAATIEVGDIFNDDESVDPVRKRVAASVIGGRFRLFFLPEEGDPVPVEEFKMEKQGQAACKDIEQGDYILFTTGLQPGTYRLEYRFPKCDEPKDSSEFIVQEKPAIEISGREFCAGQSDQRIPIGLSPAGGVLDFDSKFSSAILGNPSDGFFLNPSGVASFEGGVANIELRYEANGVAADPVVVTVYQKATLPSITESRFSTQLLYKGKAPDCTFIGRRISLPGGLLDGGVGTARWEMKKLSDPEFQPLGPDVSNVDVLTAEISVDIRLVVENGLCRETSTAFTFQACPGEAEVLRSFTLLPGGVARELPTLAENNTKVIQVIGADQSPRFKVAPVGGAFRLEQLITMDEGGENTAWMPVEGAFVTPDGEAASCQLLEYTFNMAGLPAGRYRLHYRLESCKVEVYREISLVVITRREVPRAIAMEAPPAAEEDNGGALLRKRQAGYREAIGELEADRGLAATKTFGMAKMFSLFSGQPEQLNQRYEEAARLVINSLSRASGKRKDQYQELLETITFDYLDKLVGASPGALPESSRNLITDISESMKKQGLKMAGLKRKWNGKELKEALGAAAVDDISSALK